MFIIMAASNLNTLEKIQDCLQPDSTCELSLHKRQKKYKGPFHKSGGISQQLFISISKSYSDTTIMLPKKYIQKEKNETKMNNLSLVSPT